MKNMGQRILGPIKVDRRRNLECVNIKRSSTLREEAEVRIAHYAVQFRKAVPTSGEDFFPLQILKCKSRTRPYVRRKKQ